MSNQINPASKFAAALDAAGITHADILREMQEPIRRAVADQRKENPSKIRSLQGQLDVALAEVERLQAALIDVAHSTNKTGTPQQFADWLQRTAEAALTGDPQ